MSESTTKKSTIEKIVKRVKKEYYTIEKDWELSIYAGIDVEKRTILQERKGAIYEYIRDRRYDSGTTRDDIGPPFLSKKTYPHNELSLTWLLQQIDIEELKSHFAIDTSLENANTKTPRQNEQMEQAFWFCRSVNRWTRGVQGAFLQTVKRFSMDRTTKTAFDTFVQEVSNEIFVPIMPIMVDQSPKGGDAQRKLEQAAVGDEDQNEEFERISMGTEPESKSMVSLPPVNDSNDCEAVILSKLDTTTFLNEHARTLSEAVRTIQEQYDDREFECNLISSLETKMTVLSFHAQALVLELMGTISAIESMLKKQLVAAIGKQVRKVDLDQFMRYHNEKLFTPSPKQFCYTIRRPKHYPDGILGIEESVYHDGNHLVEAITTHVREVSTADPIKVPLNAATTISLTGKTHLHGWLNQRFGRDSGVTSTRLNARARQFSSFVLVVGTMTNRNHLQPKDAIILRNKDEVHIPLLLNEIPTATEFKNTIGSLSPEQQRFAKSFRSMQLDSSVLGVCVIQIKPQMERLLGLPEGALTKEMKLTEDLTELFIEYQVPSDLVSCDFGIMTDGNGEGNVKDQVENVREHVKAVMDVIAAQKQEQLEEQKKKTEMAKAQRKEEEDEMVSGASEPEALRVCNSERRVCNRKSISMRKSRAMPMPAAGFGTVMEGCAPPEMMMMRKSDNYSAHSYSADEVVVEEEGKESSSVDSKKDLGNHKLSPSEKVIFAAMPKILDRAIELHDKNAALRSTTIKTAESDWTRIRQENLLSKPEQDILGKGAIVSEKARAFDLLDALSRSGSLDIPFSDLHVLICATHGFEKSVMDTVIQDNVNPIEKLEMSTLLMASTILAVPSRDLIRDENDRNRLTASFPMLLSNSAESANDDAIVAEEC